MDPINQNVSNVSSVSVVSRKRPLFITMMCSFYFVFWAVNLLSLTVALLMRIGNPFPAWSDIFNQTSLIFTGAQVSVSWITWLITIGLVAGIVGYWLFQRWAVIVYAASTLALFIVLLPTISSAKTGNIFSTIIAYVLVTISIFSVNLAMIVLGSIYFKRMK